MDRKEIMKTNVKNVYAQGGPTEIKTMLWHLGA